MTWKSTPRQHKAKVERVDTSGSWEAYQWFCTCGASGGRNAFISQVKASRDKHMRTRHGR